MDPENQQQIKKATKDDETNTPFFDRLPHETLIDILSRLPVTSLLQFTLLSKSLTPLSRDPYLIAAHLSRSPANSTSCLLLHSDYPILNRLHFLRLPDRTVRRIDPPFAAWMPEFAILGSSDGVLCLANALFPEQVCLYNPFTRQCEELPKKIGLHSYGAVYGFGFGCGDCKVVEIAWRGGVSEVEVYSLSSNTWRSKGELPYKLEKWSSPGVLVSGRLHWVSQWGKFNGRFQRFLVSFDLSDESFRTLTTPSSDSEPHLVGRWARCHLGALDGRLCASVPVPPGHGAFDVWVMKKYGVESSWTKEYTIGAYAPVSMISHKMETSSHIWRNMFGQRKKTVQVLCVLEGGELVLEYRGGGLVCYDVRNGCFEELVFPGMPKLYQALIHVGSLKSVTLLPWTTLCGASFSS